MSRILGPKSVLVAGVVVPRPCMLCGETLADAPLLHWTRGRGWQAACGDCADRMWRDAAAGAAAGLSSTVGAAVALGAALSRLEEDRPSG